MRRRKILFLAGYFPFGKGGAEYQAFLLAERLKEIMDVSFLRIDSGKRPVRLKKDGYTIFNIRKKPLLRKLLNRYYMFDYFKLMKLISEINPDYIYQRVAFAYTGIASYYTKKNRCKMIWHIASDNDVKKVKFNFSRRILSFFLDEKILEYGIKNTNYIIGQTKYQDKLLKQNYNRSCDLIVPNFQPLPSEKIHKKLPLKIVWIANIKPIKQPKLFIELAAHFSKKSDIKFIMIGSSPKKFYNKYLIHQIARLKNLEYLGERSIDEANKTLSESHIFVNTSTSEGFPNTFIQAWMRKVPVVSLNVDPDDVLKTHKIGFHSGSFEQMVRDLNILIENSKLRRDMGERAQTYAFENHSLDRNIKRIISFIKNI